MKKFDKTPSFYNSEEVFTNFLKQTSFYKAMQNCLLNVVKLTNPKQIVELGSATGSSTFFVAKNFKDKTIVGYDFRQNIVDEAKSLNKYKNASFACMDMVDFAKQKVDADLVYMLYSFHHVVDPLTNKVEFLKNLYKNMKKGAYVCVLEAFIPEHIKLDAYDEIVNWGALRSNESYASTYWSVLSDKELTKENIKKAEKVAEFSKDNEYQAWQLVANRDNEYCIHKNWLAEQAKKAGFKIVLNESVNAIGEGVVLLQK